MGSRFWTGVKVTLGTASLALASCGHGGSFAPQDGGGHDAGTEAGHETGGLDAPDEMLHFDDAPADTSSTNSTEEVYAETPSTLYKLDPKTHAITPVGDFKGCSEVIDIALDKDSNMFATTFDGLYSVDRETAVCTLIAHGTTYPNSLSFVPAGTLDPMVEARVGYVGGTYVRIDTKTGAMTMMGSIGQGYASSGDIVSVKGGGTYLTVTGGPSGSCGDCLIQVDPSTGGFVYAWGPLGRASVFGLGFWGGSVFGFDTAGDVFEVDFHGAAMQVTNIPYGDAPAGLKWFGAGSTTSAPLSPPK